MNAVLYLLFWALNFAVQIDSTPDASEDSKEQGASKFATNLCSLVQMFQTRLRKSVR